CDRDEVSVQLTANHAVMETYTDYSRDHHGDSMIRKSSELVYYVYGSVISGRGRSPGEVVVFQNRNSSLEGKWASSEMSARMHVGSCYQLSVYGWRIPVFDSYPNIVGTREIRCPEKQSTDQK